ncbi:MAG: hypothetical protein C4576_16865 [Desulfobacteraceae bacterium]|nr:MAG: hypothetical protein C4576_16865 [Desulfobacteraceae bacterium]
MRRIKLSLLWIALITFSHAAVIVLPEIALAMDRVAETGLKVGEAEEKWGIKPLAVRLTGADHFLEFRYKVVDEEKAKPVLDRRKKALLRDQETGAIFDVTMTKMGAMRGNTKDPKLGKQYFILFTNAGQGIKRGHKVTVVIDECSVEGMKVE